MNVNIFWLKKYDFYLSRAFIDPNPLLLLIFNFQ